jgi:hypothetical protein
MTALDSAAIEEQDPAEEDADAGSFLSRYILDNGHFSNLVEAGPYLHLSVWASGGARYGNTAACRVRREGLAVEQCVSFEYHGDGGGEVFSPDGRYLYVENLQYMGHTSFILVDLEQSRIITPEHTPPGWGAPPGFAAFNQDSTRLAVFNGELWVYAREPAEAELSLLTWHSLSDTLVPNFDHLDEPRQDGQATVDLVFFSAPTTLTLVRGDGQLLALDVDSAEQAWRVVDNGMPAAGPMQAILSADGQFFALQNAAGLRVFLTSSGAPVTQTLRFEALGIPTEHGEDPEDPQQTKVGFEGESDLLITSGNSQWRRELTPAPGSGTPGLSHRTGLGGPTGVRPLALLPGARADGE